jgi:hypothetical protein
MNPLYSYIQYVDNKVHYDTLLKIYTKTATDSLIENIEYIDPKINEFNHFANILFKNQEDMHTHLRRRQLSGPLLSMIISTKHKDADLRMHVLDSALQLNIGTDKNPLYADNICIKLKIKDDIYDSDDTIYIGYHDYNIESYIGLQFKDEYIPANIKYAYEEHIKDDMFNLSGGIDNIHFLFDLVASNLTSFNDYKYENEIMKLKLRFENTPEAIQFGTDNEYNQYITREYEFGMNLPNISYSFDMHYFMGG